MGTAPPNFRPMSVGTNRLDGWRCHLVRRYRPWPRQYCVRSGPSPPPKKGSTAAPPLFGPCLLWVNGWMDQNAIWYGDRPQPRAHCVRWRLIKPRVHVTQPGTRQYRTYTHTQSHLLKAIDAVNKGSGLRAAAKDYKILIGTLHNKLKRKHEKHVGTPTALSPTEDWCQ